MDIHVELRYDGFNSVQQIGYTAKLAAFSMFDYINEKSIVTLNCDRKF